MDEKNNMKNSKIISSPTDSHIHILPLLMHPHASENNKQSPKGEEANNEEGGGEYLQILCLRIIK